TGSFLCRSAFICELSAFICVYPPWLSVASPGLKRGGRRAEVPALALGEGLFPAVEELFPARQLLDDDARLGQIDLRPGLREGHRRFGLGIPVLVPRIITRRPVPDQQQPDPLARVRVPDQDRLDDEAPLDSRSIGCLAVRRPPEARVVLRLRFLRGSRSHIR